MLFPPRVRIVTEVAKSARSLQALCEFVRVFQQPEKITGSPTGRSQLLRQVATLRGTIHAHSGIPLADGLATCNWDSSDRLDNS